MSVSLAKSPAYSDRDVQIMVRGYLECALWLSVNPAHYDDPEEPENLNAVYDLGDIAPKTESQAWDDVDAFVVLVGSQLTGIDPSSAGCDFWLTRNGHGAGFWDRGYGDVGDALTIASETFGGCELYPGDDGKLYF